MEQIRTKHRALKAIKSILVALCMLSLLYACNEGGSKYVVTTIDESMREPDGLHVCRMVWDDATRGAIMELADSDKVWIRFKVGDEYVQGSAVYSATQNEWTLTYTGSLVVDLTSSCTVYFFNSTVSDTTSLSSTSILLDEQTAVYYDLKATYTRETELMYLSAHLNPVQGKIRFQSDTILTFQLSGIKHYTGFDILTHQLTSSTSPVELTVGQDGYTTNVLGLPDDSRTLCIEYDYQTYTTSIEGNMLAASHSGYMLFPTERSHRGWNFTKVDMPSLSNIGFSFIRRNEACVSANLRNINIGTLSDAGWIYGTDANLTEEAVEAGTATKLSYGATTNLTDTLKGLDPSTTYYIRAYATNERGTSYSPDTCFTTVHEANPNLNEVLTFYVNGISFDMRLVEASTFTMGSGDDYYRPAHSVTLTKDYYIARTEVTQELWYAVMGDRPSSYSGASYPVQNISWNRCQDFINQLNSQTGQSFRLPTEAEWEYAARGGMDSKGYTYSGGNNADEVAWSSSNSGNTPHAVATKMSNELGLYDMSGNVFEWCSDWFEVLTNMSQTDPTGALSSNSSSKVRRGGSWSLSVGYSTLNSRDYIDYSTTYTDNDFGLRLCIDTDPVPVLSTGLVEEITDSTAIVNSTLLSESNSTVTERGIVWGTSSNPTIDLSTKTQDTTGKSAFTCTITGLEPGITYYVRAYATSSAGTAYGELRQFTTPMILATVTTTEPTDVTKSTALSGGTIVRTGGATVTAAGVVWSTSPNPTIELSTKTNHGRVTGSWASDITGLEQNTTYYVRAYATNSVGIAYGPELTFTTYGDVIASVTQVTASVNDALISTSITSLGGHTVVERGICWRQGSSKPTISNNRMVSNQTTLDYILRVEGLEQSTQYTVCSYVKIETGDVFYSMPCTFITPLAGGQLIYRNDYDSSDDWSNNAEGGADMDKESYSENSDWSNNAEGGADMDKESYSENSDWSNNAQGGALISKDGYGELEDWSK